MRLAKSVTLAKFFQQVTILPFDGQAALAAAMIENRLRSGGKVIGVPETLITGICLARNLSLFTLNAEHFKRVPGLEVLTPTSASCRRHSYFEVVTGTAKAPDRHPGSMPGTRELGVKLIFTKDTGVIIGGQAYGGTAVGELTNLLAAAVQHKMRADELKTMQVGTHPALTASPIAYQVTNAAEDAVLKLRS